MIGWLSAPWSWLLIFQKRVESMVAMVLCLYYWMVFTTPIGIREHVCDRRSRLLLLDPRVAVLFLACILFFFVINSHIVKQTALYVKRAAFSRDQGSIARQTLVRLYHILSLQELFWLLLRPFWSVIRSPRLAVRLAVRAAGLV